MSVPKVTSHREGNRPRPLHRLPLDFTINAASIFYCDKVYRLATGIEALILAITADVERFLTPDRTAADSDS
jgi:hypothetical protein